MRITDNTLSGTIIRQIQNLGSQQAKLQTEVSTGQRIFKPEDDPNAVGRVLNLQTEQRQITQYLSNADRALQLSQASYSTLQQIKNVSDRATEIGTLGGGSISPEASKAYASEVDQLIEQTLQFTNTKFNGDYVFAGTAVDTSPFVATRDPTTNQVTSVAFAGNAGQAPIQLSENASISPNTSNTTNLGLRDFLNSLVALRDALTTNNTAGVSTAQAGLLSGEDNLVSALAEHGGIQSRIEANQAQQKDRADNLESLVSNETDADLPTTIVKLNQTQTAYQAALQSAANIMRISLLDYIK
jgi:flagellar hook-associated protein 3 FlgL